jgi:hypothetical protein
MATGNNNGNGNTEATMQDYDVETMKALTEMMDRKRRHKIITKAEAKRLPALYATENDADPTVHVKLFNPAGAFTWYLTEFDPETGQAFGWVDGPYPELGYFNVYEIGSTTSRLGIPMERDCYWTPCKLSEVKGEKPKTDDDPDGEALAAEAEFAEVMKEAAEYDAKHMMGDEDEREAEAECMAAAEEMFKPGACVGYETAHVVTEEEERDRALDAACAEAYAGTGTMFADAIAKLDAADKCDATLDAETKTVECIPAGGVGKGWLALSRKEEGTWRAVDTTNDRITIEAVEFEIKVNSNTREYVSEGTLYRVIWL